MNGPALWEHFSTEIINTRWQEWVSTVCQIVSVLYARKNNVLVYPTGIIGVLLASWVYFFISSPPLYADGALNIYYFIISLYGWYIWTLKRGNEYSYPISWCSQRELVVGLVSFISGWCLLYILLVNLTNSNTPILDSLVSASAVTAMWWMALRKIENWFGWIFSNVVAIPLNFFKGFMLFTLMYILFLALAWLGYRAWKKEFESNQQ